MNGALIEAMAAVLVSWLLLAALLIGVGVAFQRLFGVRRVTSSTLLISPWCGLGLIILFLQVWQIFFPIRWPALAICAAIAAAGFWIARRAVRRWIVSVRFRWPLFIAIAITSLWAANRAIGPGDAFDSGVYHYAVVRWSHEYSIVPGLANLHPHFGFNNACHLFDAMLKVGPWETRANHLANGLLLAIWLASACISGARLHRSTGSRAQNLFHLVLLIPLVMLGVGKESSSPTSDLPQAALTFAAASALVRQLAGDGDDSPVEQGFWAVCVMFLGAAALCVKLSAAATVIPMGVIALAVHWYRTRSSAVRWKAAIWGAGLSLSLATSWVGRTIILSGCPIYPSRVFALPVDWLVPEYFRQPDGSGFREGGENVRIDMLRRAMQSPRFQKLPGVIVRKLAAATEPPYGVRTWLLAMLVAGTMEAALPSFAVLVFAIVLITRRFRRGFVDADRPSPLRSEWLIFIALVIGLVAWFAISPEPRYATSTFWVAAAALASICLRNARRDGWIVAVVTIAALLPIVYRAAILAVNPLSGTISSAFFIPAGPDHGFHPIPVAQLEPFKTRWGLTVYVTSNGGGPHWDAPLPSTGLVNHSLRLRYAGDIQSGFMADDSVGLGARR